MSKFIWINKSFGLMNLDRVQIIRKVMDREKNIFQITFIEYDQSKKPISISYPDEDTMNDYYNMLCNELSVLGVPENNGNN